MNKKFLSVLFVDFGLNQIILPPFYILVVFIFNLKYWLKY